MCSYRHVSWFDGGSGRGTEIWDQVSGLVDSHQAGLVDQSISLPQLDTRTVRADHFPLPPYSTICFMECTWGNIATQGALGRGIGFIIKVLNFDCGPVI